MRVAFFHPHFKGVGGAEVLIGNQAQYLRSRALDVSLISRVRDPERWDSVLRGISICPFQTYLRRDWYLPPAARIERALPRVIAQLESQDAVIAHNFPSCALLGMAEIPRTTRIWYCNEPNRQLHLVEGSPSLHQRVQSQGAHSAAERAYRNKLRLHKLVGLSRLGRDVRELDRRYSARSEIICANSQYTRDRVQAVYGRSDAQVIYPMIDFPAAGRPRAGRDRTRGLQVLAHSRLDPVKNLEHVIRGFALYARRAPSAALHVVGLGRQRRALVRIARGLELGDRVRFHGYLSHTELERVYDACDVFALTSFGEPFGMVYPEAAARGLLLIGPDHAGPVEILDGGDLGFLCDPFEPRALAEILERIEAMSDADIDRLRSRADSACRSRYGANTVGPMLLRLLAAATK